MYTFWVWKTNCSACLASLPKVNLGSVWCDKTYDFIRFAGPYMHGMNSSWHERYMCRPDRSIERLVRSHFAPEKMGASWATRETHACMHAWMRLRALAGSVISQRTEWRYSFTERDAGRRSVADACIYMYVCSTHALFGPTLTSLQNWISFLGNRNFTLEMHITLYVLCW